MNLGEFAAALRGLADRAESELALEACGEAARDYLTILRMVTPKRSGALADSETVTGPEGGGATATAEVGPHIIYAKFRDEGGTIHAKYGEVWKTVNGKSRMYRHTLHWEGGGFPLHVTQAGSHYMTKAQGPGRGAVEDACRVALERFLVL